MRFINGIVGLVEIVLLIRLVLEMLAADTSSQFIASYYSATDALIGPFAGAFPVLSIGGAHVVDLSIVLAMIAYAIVGWLVILVLSFIFFPAARV